jgi:predicted enzyme related to lactoylglutathione lyase
VGHLREVCHAGRTGREFDAGPQADALSDKGPILHIEVDGIDAALGRAERMGGRTLVRKTKISGEFGFLALFLDNVGNRHGLRSRRRAP